MSSSGISSAGISDSGIIVVTGPTASGKTSRSIEIAKRVDGEIVNADSVQVYKDFNIGAAKPSEQELAEVPHHLVSVVDAKQSFDVQQFCFLAKDAIADILSRGKVPIICGGTGLYLRSLLCGLLDVESIDVAHREALEAEAKQLEDKGLDVSKELHSLLAEVDPYSARHIHSNDIQRVKRALLVNRSCGQSFVKMQEEHSFGEPQYRALVMVLAPERETLHKKINARVLQMIDTGLVEEVKNLLVHYPLNSRPFGAIGYRHVAEFLRGDYSFDKMVETLKRDTRRFAKRQRTWWRNQPRYLGWTNVTKHLNDSEPLGSESLGSDNTNVKDALFFEDFLQGRGVFKQDALDEPSSVTTKELKQEKLKQINTKQKRIYFFEYDRL